MKILTLLLSIAPLLAQAQNSWIAPQGNPIEHGKSVPAFARGDINGDGHLDFIFADGFFALNGAVRVFQSKPGGSYFDYGLGPSQTALVSLSSAALVDVQGDQNPELILLYRDATIVVYPNIGGQLRPAAGIHPFKLYDDITIGEGISVNDHQVTDLDGNGKQEWLLTIERAGLFIGSPLYRQVVALKFDPATTAPGRMGLKKETLGVTTSVFWGETVLADLDGDGDKDIVSITENASTFAQYAQAGHLSSIINIGQGYYSSARRPVDLGFALDECNNPDSMIAAHLNSDQKEDLVIGCGDEPKIAIAHNQITSVTNAQVNGNFNLTWVDLAQLGYTLDSINTVLLADLDGSEPRQKELLVLARNNTYHAWQLLVFDRQGDSFNFVQPRLDLIDHQSNQQPLRDAPNPQHLHLMDLDFDGYPDPFLTWRVPVGGGNFLNAAWFQNLSQGLGPVQLYGQGYGARGPEPTVALKSALRLGAKLSIEVRNLPLHTPVYLTWGFERHQYPGTFGQCDLLVNWYIHAPFVALEYSDLDPLTGQPHALFEFDLQPNMAALMAAHNHSTMPNAKVTIQALIDHGGGEWSCTPGLEFYTFKGLEF